VKTLARQVLLASRPGPGGPAPENFRLAEAEVPPPGPGEVTLETLWLSLDPYMRARMYEGGNYAAATPLGGVMPGATVARVVASAAPDLSEGAVVLSRHGWQSAATVPAAGLERIDPTLGPLSTALGVLGMPGQTGYGGLLRHGRPQPGETVLVSAASGAVGSVVGQVARLKGARAVGIAGGAEKCRYLTEELGFAAAVDYRAPDFATALAAACPAGVDVYFDNVGGEIFATVLPLLNRGARVPVCGTISVDRNRPAPEGRDRLFELHATILVKQLTLRGFLYDELADMRAEFRREMAGWLRAGAVKYREDVVEGLENAPAAFLGLFAGRNFGKLVARVAPE